MAICTTGDRLDQALLLQLLQMFLHDNGIRVADLPRSAEGGSVDDVRRIAHTIAGSAATAGATTLATLAREIEATASSGALPPAARVAAMVQEFATVRALLQEKCLSLERSIEGAG
jgi:HPt (histidine-containing phosphotransfer) domain-containing protein